METRLQPTTGSLCLSIATSLTQYGNPCCRTCGYSRSTGGRDVELARIMQNSTGRSFPRTLIKLSSFKGTVYFVRGNLEMVPSSTPAYCEDYIELDFGVKMTRLIHYRKLMLSDAKKLLRETRNGSTVVLLTSSWLIEMGLDGCFSFGGL